MKDLYQDEAAVMEFGKTLRSDSVGFLYFSGHGLQVAGENCLVPIDAPGIRTMGCWSARPECWPAWKTRSPG